ncbi:hypothetical protein GCM10023321_73500 [Pseudonocardia eucalypti]|uniref:Uncharacterized protein n=1 Tax=Pseudonocardia eucalypti TaxID=648755 RepID=A0ABP9R8Z1_9PSEU|nr:hypothetical protein [Pseudonocardia eucalypti]
MSQFQAVLRDRVEEAVREMCAAREGGNDGRAEFYVARLAELFELAARHGVDTQGWVEDPAVAALVTSTRH